MGGHIDAAVVTTGELPDKDNGARAFRIVAQMSSSRHKALKDVPTATEQGFDVVMPAERGFAAPQALPADIAAKLQAAIEATLRDPEYLAKASNDAPVLAYLAGYTWRAEIDKRKREYEALVKMIPKQ
jgi:tripartite-type tricarboxylate transporter receptor subunit TctC